MTASFIVAMFVVLTVTILSFQYLGGLNDEIDDITLTSNRISLLSDEVRITTVAILKGQRQILMRQDDDETIDRIISLCDSLITHLQNLNAIYTNPDGKEIITRMSFYVDSLRMALSKATIFQRGQGGIANVEDLMDKILESFSDFQDIQYFENEIRNEQIKDIIQETKQKMMVTLIIGFLGTIILALVVPGKIALPFKKIKDAIRELQDCNFDVSIYYNQEDEIGEIAREMNKMIHNLKIFEELRTDRVAIERRKFDVLANMVKKPVLVANAQGKLIYLNSQLYNLLQIQSEDVIGKEMTETVVPKSIIESYELAIKRRSKIENSEIVIPLKKSDSQKEAELDAHADIAKSDVDSETEKTEENLEKKTLDSQQEDPEVEMAYRGYATVVPIRGKESSNDYYLMVLSKEVFA